MQELVQYITPLLETCIIPLIIALSSFLIKLIKKKSDEIKAKTENEVAKKYLDMAENTISSCVLATTQTFVETLKKENAFTAEAQKEAFAMSYNNILLILTDDCKEYLQNAYGDLEVWLTNKIEAEVKLQHE